MKEVRVCPLCNKEYTDYPALLRRDNQTEICPECGLQESLMAISISKSAVPRMSHYERTKAKVYATGNKWAIENFEATH